MSYMAARGHDIGESSALALYAALQMVNDGVTGDFVVILPDGVEKYRKTLEPEQDPSGRFVSTRSPL
jgi:cysteine synthase